MGIGGNLVLDWLLGAAHDALTSCFFVTLSGRPICMSRRVNARLEGFASLWMGAKTMRVPVVTRCSMILLDRVTSLWTCISNSL